MWGRATLAMEVSRTSMKAARATVAAISQGLTPGFHRPRLPTSSDIRCPFGRLSGVRFNNVNQQPRSHRDTLRTVSTQCSFFQTGASVDIVNIHIVSEIVLYV